MATFYYRNIETHSNSHYYTHDLKLHREKCTREKGPNNAYVLVRVHTNHAVFINKIINRPYPSGVNFVSRHFRNRDGRNRCNRVLK